ncbi:monooxygenase [Flavobacterium sp.]|uniref:monooxygenase n=1 Tax=Flavobacterium sp. TaxID=239 RepID=UPI0035AF8F9B
MKLLQVDFPILGPFGEEMSKVFKELADDIAKEDGLIWKIWTENAYTQEAGGIYLFADEANAQRYLEKHTKRLQGFGVENIQAKIFNVNVPLSLIDKAPL